MTLEVMEELLQQKRDNTRAVADPTELAAEILASRNQARRKLPSKAEKSASLMDFMDMIAMIVSRAMKKDMVEFSPDEGARIKTDMAKSIDHPYIFFSIVEAKPKGEAKPRVRQEVVEGTRDEAQARQGVVYGQKFEALVQFNVVACDYKTADRVMSELEDLIFGYTAYFKKNGVAELLYNKRFTDKDWNIYRQSFSVRSVRYYVEIEKLYTQFGTSMQDITVA